MKPFQTTVVLLLAIAAVFLEAGVGWPRRLLGVQVDLLPALAVLVGMRLSLTSLVLFALVGGLAFDALSLNPLGATVLPLFLVGLALQMWRPHVLVETRLLQFVLGCIAGAMVPALVLALVLTTGRNPLLGWVTLWDWAVMALACGLGTPLLFWLFEWLESRLTYRPVERPAFRPDRQIHRGRT